MRVIAGKARSMPLKSPQGKHTRPTTDRIKETLFNMLQNDVPGCVFVDLFSGSGAIGIEALSRGAKRCYFVDYDAQAIQCIRDNLTFTKMLGESAIIKADVSGALHQISEKEVDILFMDPPYDQEFEKRTLEILRDKSYVTKETLLIAEASLETDFSYVEELGFEVIRQKKYKTNQHVFIRKK